MPHWDADQYLRYANERTQAAIDLRPHLTKPRFKSRVSSVFICGPRLYDRHYETLLLHIEVPP